MLWGITSGVSVQVWSQDLQVSKTSAEAETNQRIREVAAQKAAAELVAEEEERQQKSSTNGKVKGKKKKASRCISKLQLLGKAPLAALLESWIILPVQMIPQYTECL